MSSAICFNLNQSKILSSGNGLRKLTRNDCHLQRIYVTQTYIFLAAEHKKSLISRYYIVCVKKKIVETTVWNDFVEFNGKKNGLSLFVVF